jgi:serine/threonine protein kinase
MLARHRHSSAGARHYISEAKPSPAAAKCVNQYQKLSEIGQGSFGRVFVCRDRNDGHLYALKQISLRKLSRSMLGVTQLQDELQMLRTMHHRNIISLHEVLYVPENQTIYTVTDFADCGSLEAVLAIPARPSSIELCYILKEIANGIAYLHSLQIVHQDVKPGNILLTKSGLVLLTDFGMSHTFSTPALVFGTPLYHAPESMDPSVDVTDCEGKVDVWALGITLYEMLFGTTPFQGKDVYEITAAIQNVRLDVPSRECDPDAWELILGMLRIDPTKRFSMMDVLNSKYVKGAPQEMEFPNFPDTKVPDMNGTIGIHQEQAIVCGPDYEFQYVDETPHRYPPTRTYSSLC